MTGPTRHPPVGGDLIGRLCHPYAAPISNRSRMNPPDILYQDPEWKCRFLPSALLDERQSLKV